MSHSQANIHRADNDELIGYIEYNGTVDIVLPRMHDTVDSLSENWREPDPFKHQCKCKEGLVDAVMKGEWVPTWNVKVCMTHKCVVEGTSRPEPDDDDNTYNPWNSAEDYDTGEP
jgi:hypothetical protein